MNIADAVLPDIPRLYTAAAEWLACMLLILYVKKRIRGVRLWAVCAGALAVQGCFLYFTDDLEGFWWLACMLAAMLLMFLLVYITCDVNWKDAGYYTAFAFLMAETAASLEWQVYLFFTYPREPVGRLLEAAVLLLMYGGIYSLFWQINRRLLERDERLQVDNRELASVLVIAGSVFFVSNLGFLTANTPFSGSYSREIFNIRTFADVAGLAVLYAYHLQWKDQKVREELRNIENILHNQYVQYQQSQHTLDMINYKYHDLKHHIIALRAETDGKRRSEHLDRMEQEIIDYESQNKTGNKVLDTMLTSKGMDCQQSKIQLTCVVDGSLFGFMDAMDICSIFGNALDNAIECEKKLPEEKRMIHINAYSKKNFLFIKFENYCEDQVQFEKDLPVTTKKQREFHGYGLKSLQYTVHKYEGEVNISVRDNWFRLEILIPI